MRRLPSAMLLRLLRTLAILVCLATGVMGALVMNATAGSLSAIDLGTQQTLRLQQIKGGVLRADGLATNGLAQGTQEPLSQRDAYRQALSDAAKATVEASNAQPLDSGDLATTNAALVHYAATLEFARSAYAADPANGAQYVTQAGEILDTDILPVLDRLIAANDDRVAQAKASDRIWASVLALAPVIVLVGVSIWLARRTKRVLNLGLVAALLTSVLLWRLVDVNLTATQGVVDSARNGSLHTATAAAGAYSSLAEGKAVEGRMLLLPAQLDPLQARWTTALDSVTKAVASLDASHAESIGAQVTAYTAAHTNVVGLVREDRLTDARTAAADAKTGVNPTYEAAAEALAELFSQARTETAEDMSGQRGGVETAAVVALLLGVLGAVAAGFGITQRIREYR